MSKKGLVPKPKDAYKAATPQDDGNKIVDIAPAPRVSDRDSSNPEHGPKRKKSAVHGSEYPGRTYETQTVEDAVAKPVDRDVIDKQLGSNLSTKVIAARKRIDSKK